MKNILFLIISLVHLVSFAGFGGSGGGVKMDESKYILVETCDGEANMCRQIRIKKQTFENKPFVEECLISAGEAHYAPCPKEFSVPGFFKKLDELFDKN